MCHLGPGTPQTPVQEFLERDLAICCSRKNAMDLFKSLCTALQSASWQSTSGVAAVSGPSKEHIKLSEAICQGLIRTIPSRLWTHENRHKAAKATPFSISAVCSNSGSLGFQLEHYWTLVTVRLKGDKERLGDLNLWLSGNTDKHWAVKGTPARFARSSPQHSAVSSFERQRKNREGAERINVAPVLAIQTNYGYKY